MSRNPGLFNMFAVAREFGIPIHEVERMAPDEFSMYLAYIRITNKNDPQSRV